MLTIKDATKDVKNPKAGPMLRVQLEVAGVSPDIWMDIEDLNGCTRHHKDSAKMHPGLRLFHLMCESGTADEQNNIMQAIDGNPRDFYRQIYKWNDRVDPKQPLYLFKDDAKMAGGWRQVKTMLRARRSQMQKVFYAYELARAHAAPCYAMLISQDPATGLLMDISFTAVIHTMPATTTM